MPRYKRERVTFSSGLIKQATKHVERLQKHLFKAITEGKLREIVRISGLLKRSYYNKILALWKVAHINTGKKTAGVDGKKIKLSDCRSISKIMDKLTRDLNDAKWLPMPARRVMIPKSDGTQRPLGIPTQYDRVAQFILNSILDVTVEHHIHANKCKTYGFRKYHSCADAVNNLMGYAQRGKYAIVIEADISKCFDKIDHNYIRELIKEVPAISNEIDKLLKAGFIHENEKYETTEGTPQGGIISPTLSNLVLRNVLDIPMANTPKEYFGKHIQKITLTTYADDMVIAISPINLTQIKDLKAWQTGVSQNVMTWLKKQLVIAGLELKDSKTRTIIDDTPFDFLGFNITRGKGIKLSQKLIDKMRRSLKKSMKHGRGQQKVLKEINPILRGVYNYAAKFSSGKMWNQLGKFDWEISRRIHKLYKTYDIGQVKFTDVPKTTKYIPVKTGSTWLVEDDYWNKRNLNMLSSRKKKLYKIQKGICPHCKGKFTLKADEILETHHLLAKGEGGKDTNKNVNLYHVLCHEQIHKATKPLTKSQRLVKLKQLIEEV